jgi:hypothetical protein
MQVISTFQNTLSLCSLAGSKENTHLGQANVYRDIEARGFEIGFGRSFRGSSREIEEKGLQMLDGRYLCGVVLPACRKERGEVWSRRLSGDTFLFRKMSFRT